MQAKRRKLNSQHKISDFMNINHISSYNLSNETAGIHFGVSSSTVWSPFYARKLVVNVILKFMKEKSVSVPLERRRQRPPSLTHELIAESWSSWFTGCYNDFYPNAHLWDEPLLQSKPANNLLPPGDGAMVEVSRDPPRFDKEKEQMLIHDTRKVPEIPVGIRKSYIIDVSDRNATGKRFVVQRGLLTGVLFLFKKCHQQSRNVSDCKSRAPFFPQEYAIFDYKKFLLLLEVHYAGDADRNNTLRN
ncbi:hypothetical protein HNY73_005235 [Argiope bruennichi]|uniref:Uncharacterized protein n=1 Tax=Argiope bruennichi TaxID=94029 RepID=A0A8T0FIA2_ARGBR|nr:hypothetical protein HNY73_005235 [Argiope bruennichi]